MNITLDLLAIASVVLGATGIGGFLSAVFGRKRVTAEAAQIITDAASTIIKEYQTEVAALRKEVLELRIEVNELRTENAILKKQFGLD